MACRDKKYPKLTEIGSVRKETSWGICKENLSNLITHHIGVLYTRGDKGYCKICTGEVHNHYSRNRFTRTYAFSSGLLS